MSKRVCGRVSIGTEIRGGRRALRKSLLASAIGLALVALPLGHVAVARTLKPTTTSGYGGDTAGGSAGGAAVPVGAGQTGENGTAGTGAVPADGGGGGGGGAIGGQGGNGGAPYQNVGAAGAGGAGGQTAGANGSNGGSGSGQGGGGGGGGGANGFTGSLSVLGSGALQGGAGGFGGSSSTSGGAGGGGGFGAVVTDIADAIATISNPTITGGAGGLAGSSSGSSGSAAGNGGGGLLLQGLSGTNALTVSSSIKGGAVPYGGIGMKNGGYGGDGGAGLIVEGVEGATTLTLTGTAKGGKGGDGGGPGGTGWTGGTGGLGGAGVAIGNVTGSLALAVQGVVTGGVGGAGNSSTGLSAASGGLGGAGGDGISVKNATGAVALTIGNAVTGGAGGSGGSSRNGTGADGAGGGNGVSVVNGAGTVSLLVQSAVTGGAGGAGGSSVGGMPGGAGGAGGAGIAVVNSTGTVTLSIENAVTGGNGGAGAGNAAGGAGITGQNVAIVLAGSGASVSGGLSGDGVTRAPAIVFAGGTNSLELQASGSGVLPTVTGAITHAGVDDTLKLGGSNDTTFAVSNLDDGATFSGFGTVQKTSTSTWTLTGTTTAVDWDIHGGALSISSDGALGGSAGTLGFSGGTLSTTADISSTRAVSLASGGGTFDIADGTTLTLAGAVSGEGGFAKLGSGTLAVTGDGSGHSGFVYVNAGTLAIKDGGTLAGGETVISLKDGSSGTMTVTGQNAALGLGAHALYVGFASAGTLNVEAGGKVASGAGFIGYNAASNSSAAVTGAGSTWDLGDASMSVGYLGTGHLNVMAGGKVTSGESYIGLESGSSGAAMVTGTDSTWDLGTSSLYIGHDGAGALTVEAGGKVASGDGILGYNGASQGTAKVTGTDSTWDLGGNDLYVGFSSKGTLTVEAGGKVASGNGFIGYNDASPDNSATVTGFGSTWNLGADSLSVGYYGKGSLTVEAGGKVTSGYSNIGVQSGSTGTVTVTGEGSLWALGSETLSVGYLGAGTLNIEAGGAVTGGDGVIGYEAYSNGAATVTGQGSSWDAGSHYIYVGHFGAGSLTIDDEGTVTGAKTVIGHESGSSGTLNLDGDAVNGRGVLATGQVVKGAGTATLDLNGGVLKAIADETDFLSGFAAGDIDIKAGGAFIDTNGHDVGIAAALQGTGGLTKAGGGTLSLTGVSSYSGYTIVEGGALAITDGGTLASGSGFIGNAMGASGAVTVTGTGSAWDLGFRSLTVGNLGTGAFAVADGGTVTSRHGYVGYGSGSTGTAAVTGANSNWNINGTLYAGYDGTGTVTIDDGGTVIAKGLAVLGSGAVSSGVLNLNGTADGRGVLETSQVARGAGTATLNFDGGALKASGDEADFLSNFAAGDIQLKAGGAFIDTNGHDVGIGSVLAGEGGLTKQGEGTLTLSVVNAYAGVTDIGAGTLALSGMGSIAASSGVTVTGILDISGTTGATIANLAGASAAGTVALGSQVLTVVETGDTAFAGTFSGAGGLIKQGAGTLTLTGDNSAFGGSTQVLNGTLSVSSQGGATAGLLGGVLSVGSAGTLHVEGGSLTGQIILSDGGVLDGNGAVGSLVINAAGVVAPGNSPGVITVNGTVAFNDGAIYQVDVTADGQHDLIAATGTVTISDGASVAVMAAPGTYDRHTTYTILTTDATVDGAFGSVTSDYAFLTPSLGYDDRNVYLTLLNNGISFASFAHSGNEASVATAVQALGDGNPVYDAILPLPENAVAGAFDALSGEVYASVDTVIQQQSVYVREAVEARLRQSAEAPAARPLAYAANAPATAQLGADLTLWAQGYGGWGDASGNGNAASLSNTIGGFLMGADVAVADNVRAGVFGGYGRSTFDIAARSSSGDMDNYDLGLYAGAWFGALSVRGGLAYSWHDVSVDRIATFPGFTEALNAGDTTGSLQAFGELSYDLTLGAFDVEPFMGAAYLGIDGASLQETGGAAALRADLESMNTTYTTLGVRAATSVDFYGRVLTPSVTLGWQHAFGDTVPMAGMLFTGGATPFQVSGAPIARDALLVRAGLGYAVSATATLSIGYSGQIADSASQNAFDARFSLKF